MHDKVGHDVGKYPLVVQMLKGITMPPPPPLPCYTWNVQTVLNYLDSLGDNDISSLKQLTLRITILLALTRPSRSLDLSTLDCGQAVYTRWSDLFT